MKHGATSKGSPGYVMGFKQSALCTHSEMLLTEAGQMKFEEVTPQVPRA